MADYIDREKEIKSWEKAKRYDKDEHYSPDEIISDLMSAPSIDAVEVVRCKDCKYRNKDYCLRLGKLDEEQNSYFLIVNYNDFCKWGEKE